MQAEDDKVTSEDQLRAAIQDRLPSVYDLLGTEHIKRLIEARNRGTVSSSSSAAIDILLGKQIDIGLIRQLNCGLELIRKQGNDLTTHLKRLTEPKDFREARGAANELWVAAHATNSGGSIELEQPHGYGKKPDLTLRYEDELATFEVVSLNATERCERANNNLLYKFHRWARGKTPPSDILGHARDCGPGLRMLSMTSSVLGDGPSVRKIDRLIQLKDTSQLQGRPCPVLVISARHQWNFPSMECAVIRRVKGSMFSGIGYAATYGQKGRLYFPRRIR